MKRLNERTTELLIRLLGRLQIHAQAVEDGKPIISVISAMMVDVELDALWMLTQM